MMIWESIKDLKAVIRIIPLHSIWAGQELYRKGNSKEMFYNILEKEYDTCI